LICTVHASSVRLELAGSVHSGKLSGTEVRWHWAPGIAAALGDAADYHFPPAHPVNDAQG